MTDFLHRLFPAAEPSAALPLLPSRFEPRAAQPAVFARDDGAADTAQAPRAPPAARDMPLTARRTLQPQPLESPPAAAKQQQAATPAAPIPAGQPAMPLTPADVRANLRPQTPTATTPFEALRPVAGTVPALLAAVASGVPKAAAPAAAQQRRPQPAAVRAPHQGAPLSAATLASRSAGAPPATAPRPVLHISIDRIDVRLPAAPPRAAAPARPQPAAPVQSLKDYLRGGAK